MSRESSSAVLRLFVLASGAVAAFLAAPIAADAQTLYRCVQKGKPTSFQSAPCAATAKTASAVAYVPEQNVPPYRPAPSQPPRRQPTSGARLHQISMATNTTACESARRHRDIVLDAVAKACN